MCVSHSLFLPVFFFFLFVLCVFHVVWWHHISKNASMNNLRLLRAHSCTLSTINIRSFVISFDAWTFFLFNVLLYFDDFFSFVHFMLDFVGVVSKDIEYVCFFSLATQQFRTIHRPFYVFWNKMCFIQLEIPFSFSLSLSFSLFLALCTLHFEMIKLMK